jgi:hypothetical protein
MKTQRVLWIGIPPSPIWQGLENLQRDVGAGLVALGGEIARRPLWLLGTQVLSSEASTDRPASTLASGNLVEGYQIEACQSAE